jgi:transposase
LIFLDESGAKTNLTRLRGRAQRGQRVNGSAPAGHWQTITLMGALRLDGSTACMALEGTTDTDSFRAYVRSILVPALRPGDIVVMDNLAAHKVAGVREAIRAVEADVLYLPSYSPDLNPIEHVFAKIKQEIRKRKPRTKAECDALCGECLDWFTAPECRNYLKHAGYIAQDEN